MLVIREATASDAPLIVEMIRELAHFERELDQVDTTPDDLVRDGFGENPSFHAFLAEWDGQPAAYILYFFTYSTWAGRLSACKGMTECRPAFLRGMQTSPTTQQSLPPGARTRKHSPQTPVQFRKKFRVILFPGDLILRANWVRVSGCACCPLSHLVGTCMRQAFMCNGIRQFAPAV
jgi:hypothetical protein